LTIRYFEDFHEGEEFSTPSRTVTETDVMNFAGVSGDFNSIHTDEEYAKRTAYGGRIAHGFLTLAVASGLWFSSGVFEESLVALYGIENMRFIKPVRFGDTLTVKLKVITKRERKELGIVTVRNEVVNQKGEVVLGFDAMLLLKKNNAANRISLASTVKKK
jgi:3-hydroxybutyryl-CoA dehydratase